VPAALGSPPLLCHCSPSAAFEQQQAEVAAQPAREPSCSLLPAAVPGCWVLASPSAFAQSPQRPPPLPLTQHPLIVGSHGAHRQGAGCVHPTMLQPLPRRGLPRSWMGCKQTPILIKPQSECCSLLSPPACFQRRKEIQHPFTTWCRSPLLPCAASKLRGASALFLQCLNPWHNLCPCS